MCSHHQLKSKNLSKLLKDEVVLVLATYLRGNTSRCSMFIRCMICREGGRLLFRPFLSFSSGGVRRTDFVPIVSRLHENSCFLGAPARTRGFASVWTPLQQFEMLQKDAEEGNMER